jgi:polysaccharide pyruvyl transferase CsaB
MRYLVDGCYGDGNVGDECLLKAVCELVRGRDDRAEIVAMSSRPAETRTMHGLPAVLQVNPFGKNLYGAIAKRLLWQTIREIRRCDVFILGGGELFRDVAGFSATLGMFYRMHLARRMGKRVIALGVGAQQPTKRWGKYVLRRSLMDADSIVFRDPRALGIAASLAPKLPAAVWAPDLVFSLAQENAGLRRAVARNDSDVLRIGVAIKSLPRRHRFFEAAEGRVPAALVQSLRTLAAERTTRVTAVAFAEADRPLARRVAAELRLANIAAEEMAEASAERLQAAISRQDCMLAMPFHASVFAFAAGVPTMGLAYDPKVARLYQTFGLEGYCLPLGDLQAGSAVTCLRRLVGQRVPLSRHLLRASGEARTEIRDTVERILAKVQIAAEPPGFSSNRGLWALRSQRRTTREGDIEHGQPIIPRRSYR